jgi:hypothetical protein
MALVFDLEFSCEAFFKAFSSGSFCHKQKAFSGVKGVHLKNLGSKFKHSMGSHTKALYFLAFLRTEST